MEVTKEKAAYAAGFFDGEGTVYVGKKQGRGWNFSVSVVNTNRDVIDWFAEHFGGKTYTRPACSGGWKERHQWYIFGKSAGDFLSIISPFVIVKRDDVRIGLAFISTLGHRNGSIPLPVDVEIDRQSLLGEIRAIRRGPAAETEPGGAHD